MTEKDTKAKNFDILHFVADNAGLSTFDAIEKAYYMGVSDREFCEDCISRQDVLDLMQMRMGAKELYKAVYDLPSVTPAQKTGRWIRKPIRNDKGGCVGAKMICTYCGKDNECGRKLNYCPNCGAKMEREE